jgi:hypothetical protein
MINRIIKPSNIMPRVNNLGQLDKEIDYGPSPVDRRDVPVDLQEKYVNKGRPKGWGYNPDGTPDLDQLVYDVHSIASTLMLSVGLLGRVVVVTSTPSLIINAQYDRAYLLLNPAGAVGLTTTGTLISSQTLVGATTLTSGSLGVANYKTARFFVEATFGAGAGPVTFDLQTLNPATGNYITSQTIFSLTATGNAYADVGTLGVDTDLQMFVTVPLGTTITFSVGYVLKDGLEGTSAGASQTIFLGQAGVNPSAGYPLLNGKEKQFYFKQNVNLYAVTSGPSLILNIFEL